VHIQNLLDLAEDDDGAQFLEDARDLEFTDELNRFDLMSVGPIRTVIVQCSSDQPLSPAHDI
jgi:hypothetical protein